jgi:hypothetical protein
MNKKELQFVELILSRCKPCDTKIAKALALVRKDLACYDARKGQLRESYEHDSFDLHLGGL